MIIHIKNFLLISFLRFLLGDNNIIYIRISINSGDLDMVFPYVGTEKWIRDLNLPIVSPWEPWFVRNQVAG